MPDRQPLTALSEVRALFAELPDADRDAEVATAAREGQLTKPAGALGRLEEITAWMASWQGRHPPTLNHPRVCVFAGNHGVASRGVSAFPAEVTAQMVQNFIAGGAAVNQLCKIVDADLRVYEMALDQPTADFCEGPAMSDEDCARAIAYGMMAVEPGIDLLAVGEMGIGNTTAAAAICLALHGGTAAAWTGPGTGVGGEGLTRKQQVVAQGVATNTAAMTDPLEVLRCLGGQEMAAMAGAILAARMAQIPVLLDGFVCTAAAATLFAIDEHALDHCLIAHQSAEPGHARLAEHLGMAPLLNLEMRLGEASGAALAITIIRAALECHTGMATFADAKVSGSDSAPTRAPGAGL